MSDCFENIRERGHPARNAFQGAMPWLRRAGCPRSHPSSIFMHGGEPKDHEVFAQNDRACRFFHSIGALQAAEKPL
jgi:hypothetical protein